MVSFMDLSGTIKARHHIQLHWTYMLEHLHLNWPSTCYWDVTVVYQFSCLFLAFTVSFDMCCINPYSFTLQVEITCPCPGHTLIKAQMVASWMTIFIHLIVTLTHDPAINTKYGFPLLTQHDLHNTLQQQVFHHALFICTRVHLFLVVHEHNLNRFYDKQI